MSADTADAFANREQPVQLLAVNYDDVSISSSEGEETGASATGNEKRDKTLLRRSDERANTLKSDQTSLQDRLLSRLLAQVIPSEDHGEQDYDQVDDPSWHHATKPPFSLPAMSTNFRLFNARIGVVFVFQDQVVRLLSWQTTTHTLSLLAVYTLVCLDPYLLVALPLAGALLFIMVPAFIARHPPPPRPALASSSLAAKYHADDASYSGPAIAPPRTVKPAAETSKDFFRNMRDLQNSMADFTHLHDLLVSVIAPATNFSDEILSSTIFVGLTVLTAVLFLAAHLIPFRFLFLLGGHAMIISGHPAVQIWLIKQQKRAERQLARTTQPHTSIHGVSMPANRATWALSATLTALSEITLSTTPESREVEVFELQHRPLIPIGYSSNVQAGDDPVYEWQPHLFTPSPYEPLSPARISGDRPKGTRFFEDVQPPSGWEWGSKKWTLDLEAGEWVNERLVVGVEFDVIKTGADADAGTDADADAERDEQLSAAGTRERNTHTEHEDFATQRRRAQSVNLDFGGWVWDLPPSPGTSGNRDEDVWLAYGDYDVSMLASDREDSRKKHKKKQKEKQERERERESKDWEETIRYGNKGRTGEWRRRRWVRIVKRTSLSPET